MLYLLIGLWFVSWFLVSAMSDSDSLERGFSVKNRVRCQVVVMLIHPILIIAVVPVIICVFWLFLRDKVTDANALIKK